MRFAAPVATATAPSTDVMGQSTSGQLHGDEVQPVGGSDPRTAIPQDVPLSSAHSTASADARRMMLSAAGRDETDVAQNINQSRPSQSVVCLQWSYLKV